MPGKVSGQDLASIRSGAYHSHPCRYPRICAVWGVSTMSLISNGTGSYRTHLRPRPSSPWSVEGALNGLAPLHVGFRYQVARGLTAVATAQMVTVLFAPLPR